MKLRKLNSILHRDLGYLFFGMCIIYAISGIALNHLRDFNPNYVIKKYNVTLNEKISRDEITKDWVISLLNDLDMKKEYKKHYFPSNSTAKVFLNHGNVEINLETGKGAMETIRKRPVLNQFNYLHYNPGVLWKWFSDIFCVAFIIIALSGLFIIRSGKNSIKGWKGAGYTVVGILIPLILFLMYI
ncbi:MAG: PepSY-associated TM helix domain-containing protein [Deltaproteobacteria bacterium]|nr:PepSY-associated TM helix domain-containing protein [Deltaproteobacteria bacterium]